LFLDLPFVTLFSFSFKNGYSFWHATIYTSSFFFLCSKANIVEAENQLPRSENYAPTRMDSFSRE
jgi:hypothetical protein